MLKSKKFWAYEPSQGFELKQDMLDSYKLKGRFYEDVTYFYELMGVAPHPGLKIPYGKEHIEPNAISMVNTLVDINTLKILFAVLPYSKVVTLKFCSNSFDISNLEFLFNSLITKPNNIFNLIYEWNDKITIEGNVYSIKDINQIIDEKILSVFIKSQQLLSKVLQSPKLEALCLRGNFMGDETAIAIFESLKVYQSVKILNMYKNNLTGKIMAAFCAMIEVNKKLEEVNLGANNLTDDNLFMLKKYVGKIPMTAEDVEMHNKKLKERDAIIAKNVKLKIQKKPEEHVPILDEVVLTGDTYYTMKNNRLKILNVMQNQFTENCYDAIIYILDFNSDLLITIDGKVFNQDQKDIFLEPYGKYLNRIYLTK